jgi:hypothetical protein
MALVGSLRDLSLPELLAIISNGEKSGIITIRSDAATAQIHVDEGRIVLASDTLRDERFGEIMLKLGKISQDTLTSALEAQETSGGSRRLGSILVEMGAITPADQDAAILYQSCEALYDLCTWQVGYFQFDAQETPERSGISIQVDTLLEEVDRRAQAGERARAESIRPPTDSPLRGRREITPDKLELLRLTRSFHLHTDEFTPLQDSDAVPAAPAGGHLGPRVAPVPSRVPVPPPATAAPGRAPVPPEDPVFDVGEFEARAGDGESL